MKFENNTPIGVIKIKGPFGEKKLEATIDTGAFKSLISLDLCKELGLHLKEEREVRGVSEKPVKAKIFWAEIVFQDKKINTVVGFNLPVDKNAREFEKALIGRDILESFRLTVDFKDKEIEFEDC
jgi:predicted aspartyl protease